MRQSTLAVIVVFVAACGVDTPDVRTKPQGPVVQDNNSGSTPTSSGPVTPEPSAPEPSAPVPEPTGPAPVPGGCDLHQVQAVELCADDFVVPAEQPWRHPVASAFAAAQGASKHRGYDLMVSPGHEQWLMGKFVYGPFDYDLVDETVEIWVQSPACTWSKLASVLTSENGSGQTYNGVEDDGGRVFYQIPAGHELGLGTYRIKLVVLGDQSVGTFSASVWPEGASFAVTDLDGTMTTSETDGVWTAFDPSSPQARFNGQDLMSAYAVKNIHPIFLTARPEFLTNGTRQWLVDQHFPFGPLHLSPSSTGVSGQDAADYKGAFVQGLVAQGFNFVWGVGNRWSDYAAYTSAGLSPDHVLLYDDGSIGSPTTGAVIHSSYAQFLSPVLCEAPKP